MFQKTIVAENTLDLHKAALLVQTASRYHGAVHLVLGNKTANSKSIMSIVSLGILDGMQVQISADGEEAETAVAEIAGILARE